MQTRKNAKKGYFSSSQLDESFELDEKNGERFSPDDPDWDIEIKGEDEEKDTKPSLDPCDYESLKPHHCSVCHKGFKAPGDLKKHFRTHTGEKPYQCSICSRSFAIAGNLAKHRKCVHSDVRPFQCHVCKKSYKLQCHLNAHLVIHSGVKAYRCGICDKDFVHLWSWHCHMSNHNGVYKYQCPVCNKGYNGSSDYKRHLYIHGGEKPLKCQFCDRRYSHTNALKKHVAVHHTVRNLKCNRCEKIFESRIDLKKHKIIHKGQKHLKCDTCSMAFGKLSHLKRHSKVHVNRPFLCLICKQSFRKNEQLQLHKETHVNILNEAVLKSSVESADFQSVKVEFSYRNSSKSCPVCNKACEKYEEFLDHMQMVHNVVVDSAANKGSRVSKTAAMLSIEENHNDTDAVRDGESEDFSEKLTSRKESLSVNRESEKKDISSRLCNDGVKLKADGLDRKLEKLFVINSKHECPICRKSFQDKSDYKCHLDTHKVQKPLKCNFCDQRYVYSNALKKHIALHHSDINLKCKHCNKVFKSNNELEKHEVTCKSEEKLQCVLCLKEYSSMVNLKRHYGIHKNKSCKFCDKRCETTEKLCNHMRVVHNVADSTICNQEIVEKTTTLLPYEDNIYDYFPVGGDDDLSEGKESNCYSSDANRESESEAVNNRFFYDGVKLKKPVEKDVEKSFASHSEHHSPIFSKSYNKSQLECHLSTHRGEKLLKNDFCDEQPIYNNPMKKHTTVHCPGTNLKINYCKKIFEPGERLKKHNLLQKYEEKLGCDVCQKEYSNISNLKRHFKIHKNKSCTICNKSYETAEKYNHHMVAVHNVANCLINDQSTLNKSTEFLRYDDNLYNYFPIDDGEMDDFDLPQSEGRNKQYRDTNADLQDDSMFCIDGAQLKTEEWGENLETPIVKRFKYMCPICSRNYNDELDYKYHLYTHGGEKPLKCDFCEQRYVYNTALKKHIDVHHLDRNLEGNDGGKVCATTNELEKLTNKDGNYQPDSCKDGFQNGEDILNNKVKLNSCIDCNKTYKKKEDLLHHIHVLHDGVLDSTVKSKGRNSTNVLLPNQYGFRDSLAAGDGECVELEDGRENSVQNSIRSEELADDDVSKDGGMKFKTAASVQKIKSEGLDDMFYERNYLETSDGDLSDCLYIVVNERDSSAKNKSVVRENGSYAESKSLTDQNLQHISKIGETNGNIGRGNVNSEDGSRYEMLPLSSRGDSQLKRFKTNAEIIHNNDDENFVNVIISVDPEEDEDALDPDDGIFFAQKVSDASLMKARNLDHNIITGSHGEDVFETDVLGIEDEVNETVLNAGIVLDLSAYSHDGVYISNESENSNQTRTNEAQYNSEEKG